MKITKRSLDAIDVPQKETFFWDALLKGFGVKVYPSGRKVFILQGRLNGRVRRYTIGQYGAPWSPDQAREQALVWLSDIARGIDPTAESRKKRTEPTIGDLASQYLEEITTLKKTSTQQTEQSVLKRHLLPLIGRKRVSEVTRSDVRKMMADINKGKSACDEKTGVRGRAIVKGGPGAANRTLAVLSSLLNYSIEQGLRSDNPTVGIKKFELRKHDRYLSKDELERLGSALKQCEAEGMSPFAIAAIRFMALTGCRSGEARNLQWDWIDWEHGIAKLPDSKTGQKPLLLGGGAIALLKSLPKVLGSPLVFVSAVGDETPISIQKVWRRVRKIAELNDLRLHDLRHNFASTAVSSGQSLYLVGKLLGHTQSQTTQRYAHLAPDPVRQAADLISMELAEKIGE